MGARREHGAPLHFLTRTTEDKLCSVLDRAEYAGAEVLHISFKGGRDYAVVSRGAIPGPAGSRVFHQPHGEE